MRTAEQRPRRVRACVVLVLLVLLTACGGEGAGEDGSSQGGGEAAGTDGGSQAGRDGSDEGADGGSDDGSEGEAGEATAPADEEYAVDPPGELERPLLPADMLIYSQEPLDDEMIEEIADLDGVTHVERLSLTQVAVQDRTLQVAAVDPAQYRRFTPVNTAQLQEGWDRVAGGELAIEPKLGERLEDEAGHVQLGNDQDSPKLHIGAYAPQVPQIDAVVNRAWAESLGMPDGNAALLSTGMNSPQSVRKPLQRITGDTASIQVLGPDLDTSVAQTAFLTAGSVGEAVGKFSYRVLDGGRIQPDQGWVDANIRTEDVPILGTVTCHRVMLPQLRGALRDVQLQGLADEINPDEYAGCYYPRFIANSTSLSLHSWGIAVDLNVPGNQRGTEGEMHREVVAIFKKWGFAWGGDWSFTDPMHFELARLVEAR